MLKLSMFSVYDSKAAAFLPPFFLPNAAMGIRVFGQCCNDKSHEFGRSPADFSLFFLGTFETASARVELRSSAEVVCLGIEMVRSDGDQLMPAQGSLLKADGSKS